MKIVCALDSFKGSLTSLQAANAIKEGIGKNHEVIIKPLADGGEGTVDALCECMHAKKRTIPVTGPFLEKVNAAYGMTEDNIAIIEMCSAAGITLVKKEQLDPYCATTFGVGEIIQDACNHGCRKFLIGIGGSCTNDGGVGMLQALGYHFLDQNAKEVCFGAKGLKDIISIDDTYVDSRIKECSFFILSDVKNPLCGKQGASYIFGPQKGADQAMIEEMDAWMVHFASIVKDKYCEADHNYPGSGAAGGLGYALHTFLHGEMKRGISFVLEEIQLEKAIQEADLIITGEGKIDAQTAMGKAPLGVAQLAKKYQKPVIAFCGCVGKDAEACNENGIDAFFSIQQSACSIKEAMDTDRAYQNLKSTSKQVIRLIEKLHKYA